VVQPAVEDGRTRARVTRCLRWPGARVDRSAPWGLDRSTHRLKGRGIASYLPSPGSTSDAAVPVSPLNPHQLPQFRVTNRVTRGQTRRLWDESGRVPVQDSLNTAPVVQPDLVPIRGPVSPGPPGVNETQAIVSSLPGWTVLPWSSSKVNGGNRGTGCAPTPGSAEVKPKSMLGCAGNADGNTGLYSVTGWRGVAGREHSEKHQNGTYRGRHVGGQLLVVERRRTHLISGWRVGHEPALHYRACGGVLGGRRARRDGGVEVCRDGDRAGA